MQATNGNASVGLPVLARQRLLARCLGKQELADKLVQLLLSGLPKDALEIQNAIDSKDMKQVATLSHRLKGAAANMCADTLSSAAAALESAARHHDSEVLPTSWFTLQQQIDLVLQELTS